MRKSPMSKEEYDAVTAKSPAYRFVGTIEQYWQPMRCGEDKYYDLKTALRLEDGSGVPFDVTWPVSGNACAHFPVGTKITIEIPAGITHPFNFFVEQSMTWRTIPAQNFMWKRDWLTPPPTEEEKYNEDDEDLS